METVFDKEFIKVYTIGEIVALDYRAAAVFDDFGIDFCCGGSMSIAEACLKKKVSPRKLESALLKIDPVNNSNERVNFSEGTVNLLIDHLVGHHHRYVRAYIPFMQKYLAKMEKVHADNNSEITDLETLFSKLAESLIKNMDKEERLLFPFIRKLEDSIEISTQLSSPSFFWLIRPIQLMHIDHERALRLMKEITGLSNSFTSTEGVLNTWNVCHSKLNEFEEELKMHIHLENNVLFPKSQELERVLNRIDAIN